KGDPGAEPDLAILIPENRIPWAGHSGYHAARDVMRLIEQHRITLVFCNTRGLAELTFQRLWSINDQSLPIGIHHGSLAVEARRMRGSRTRPSATSSISSPPAATPCVPTTASGALSKTLPGAGASPNRPSPSSTG